MSANQPVQHFDVVIVGAGLSGIAAAYHLQDKCPDRSYAILEARDAIGGTWDLFRYPGVRSDSDMYTLGYSFRPWTDGKAIADGPSIRQYVRDTARDNDIEKNIRFHHRVKKAAWSSEKACWTVETETGHDNQSVRFTCNFLFMCSGYYNYEQGYTPDFAGLEDFQGQLIHPQKWPDDLDYSGKQVVIIGSGATAVTLVPSMADKAAHVTMLQRSPSYFLSLPYQDVIANALRRLLPDRVAYALTRWKNVLLTMYFYQMCKRRPEFIKKWLRKRIRKELGAGYDLDTHFTPDYNPWDQRLCFVPDNDMFAAIREGHASVVTDHIERFTADGIRLKSGRELQADIVVTATGLNLLALGGMQLAVDGREIELSDTMGYKGMMLSDVPNMAVALGYTNASWTLKCDLTCEYVCRLLNHMAAHGYQQVTPRVNDPDLSPEPFIDLKSGYVQRSIDQFPSQGSKAPWRLYQNYLLDIFTLRLGKLEDGALEFARPQNSATVAENPAN